MMVKNTYMKLYFVLMIFSWKNYLYEAIDVSAKNSLVWGPGLDARVTLPARYFFVQSVDRGHKNVTESPGEDAFLVRISTSSSARVRAWVQKLDRHDGSFIVRYRMFESYRDLTIEILHEGQHVAKSPYTLQGGVYHETCFCPESNTEIWEKAMKCPLQIPQIMKDLAPFGNIHLKELAKEAVKRFGTNHALCHYSVINNKVYRKTYGQHVGFAMFMDNLLLSLARKVVLPDMEFFVNLGDWPLVKQNSQPIPILSWCGSDDTLDIVMPTYDLTESTLETMGRVSLDMLSVQSNTGPKWDDKISKALWRGRDSREERLNLVMLARKKPQLYDAALTNFFFFKYDESKYGPKAKHMSFFDFFKWKYQINIDGTVAAYRFPYLLAGDALVLKQQSPYYEHFYKELQGWHHYIPFKRDLSDLEEKLKWAMANDEKAQQIAKAAQEYTRNNLLSEHVFCYHWILFKEYAKRQDTQPVTHPGMELIKQPDDSDSKCRCLKKVRDEL
ncbi:PREDICTED: KDEL motif-containing protein 1-like [Acropora digitifera]|uniref:KDEL motif-containing protein 1-like n=1 Tax=Acropora digitifera TaxID=70779 RepID=UPI00077A4CA9|nr:PREDICTED: KDEL motif-containing protein 1-like [Acropora digitifera]